MKTVVVHSDLREHDPMAWDFVINFARDNNLRMSEVAVVPGNKPTP